ncbi:MAG: MlaD family protein [Myxococcota bacterium]|nr:MlaD family protein [Myxococcota bacterium]
MITRSEKLRLGVFLVTSFALVAVTVLVLAGLQLSEKTDRYTVRFEESVSGLEIGAQVKYNGVRVGQITDIAIDKDNLHKVIATLELRSGTPVKADTTAVLVAMGITGLKFVELTGGTRERGLIPPGSEIKAGQSLMGALEGKAQDIAVKIEIALTKMNQVLSEENISELKLIVANVEALSTQAKQLVETNGEKFTEIVENVRVASAGFKGIAASASSAVQNVDGMVTETRPKVATILAKVDDAADSFKKAAQSLARVDKVLNNMSNTLDHFNQELAKADVSKLIAGAQNTVAEAEATAKGLRRVVDASREDVYMTVRALRRTMRNLEELSSDLKNQPSLIINSKPPKQRDPEKEE